jgi:RNA polymerase sigma factor (sigma-70 family)
MDDRDLLARRFEEHRPHLRAVSYRMLGSLSEADDAVQEAWLRLSRSDADAVENLGGWLTTVVARICLNALRSRTARREEPLEPQLPDLVIAPASGEDPEQSALLADAVGIAVLVVLQTLSPAERLAFVLPATARWSTPSWPPRRPRGPPSWRSRSTAGGSPTSPCCAGPAGRSAARGGLPRRAHSFGCGQERTSRPAQGRGPRGRPCGRPR